MKYSYILIIVLFFSCNNNTQGDHPFKFLEDKPIATSVGNLALGSYNISDEELIENRKLIEWIVNEVKENRLKAYYPYMPDPSDTSKNSTIDSLMSDEDLKTIFSSIDTFIIIDPVSGEEKIEYNEWELNVDRITKIKVEQNWAYDKMSNQMLSKIKEVKLLKDIYDEDGNFIVSAVIFKVKFD
jgi:hypothetical protein